MSFHDPDDREFAALSAATAVRADQVCDCFEATWRTGERPLIEEFLDDASEPARTIILRELIALESTYRRSAGESPTLSEYQARFPDREATWLALAVADGRAQGHCATGAGAAVEMFGHAQPSAIERPIDASADSSPRTRRLGKFELIERVGAGASGSVWRAHDHQLDREVAVKIPHAELVDSPKDLARIYREARTVAQLRHPGIVSVHEVFVHDGLPILVSDFVVGTPLRDLLAQGRLPHREAAALIGKVAEALAYAHNFGAIHRDIKPANIMIDRQSEGGGPRGPEPAPRRRAGKACALGEPRIVDFGLAFWGNDAIRSTEHGQLVGTPAYMSPEQAEGCATKLDGRADVYSLGVVLYEALSGAIPFTGTRSEVLCKLAVEEPRPLRQIDRTISRDLETICQKAMAKEVHRRYDTARDFADDLKRYLDGETIRARPARLWERVWRNARRHPAEFAAMVMVAVTALAVVGLAVGWRYHVKLLREYVHTDQARRSEEVARRHAQAFLYYNRMALAEREFSASNVDRVERLLADCPPALRGWEWSYLKRQCHHELFSIPHGSNHGRSLTVTRVVFSPDGKNLVTACKDGTIRLWDASTGQFIRAVGHSDRAVFGLAHHPALPRVASSGEDGLVKIWDVSTGTLVRTIPGNTGTVYCVAYSPDGSRLASGDGCPPWEHVDHWRTPGVVRVFEEASGRECLTLRGHTQNVMGVAFSPDGGRLASVSGGVLAIPLVAARPGEMMIWDTKQGSLIRSVRGQSGPLTSVAFSPDGGTLATSSWDRTAVLWDAETGTQRATLAGHQDWVCHVAFDKRGQRLATASADGAVRLWDVVGGRLLATFHGHKQSVACLDFDPIGDRLASASSDQTVKLWDSSVSREAVVWRGRGPVVQIALFADSRRLIVGSNFEQISRRIVPTLTVLDTTTGKSVTLGSTSSESGDSLNAVAVSPRGDLVVAALANQQAELRDPSSGALIATLATPDVGLAAATFTPDNSAVVLAGLAPVTARGERLGAERKGGYLGLWDIASRSPRWERISGDTNKIRSVDISPDGRLLATADNEDSVTLWDMAKGIPIRRMLGHRRLVAAVAFSPDGQRIASASWDQTGKVWDVASGQEVVSLRGHMRSVVCIAFSPDGSRLATGSDDRTVKLWDASTGEEVLTLRSHTGIVSSVAFSADGRLLASASIDGTVQVREAEPTPIGMAADSSK